MNRRSLVWSVLVLAVSASALAGQLEYDNCILGHMGGARLDMTARMIKQACTENHLGVLQPTGNRRAYNDCLLQHLPGVESAVAATEIDIACGSRYL